MYYYSVIFFDDRISRQFEGFCRTNQLFIDSPIEQVTLFPWKPTVSEMKNRVIENVPDRLVLGKKAERYFADWINEGTAYNLLEENVQVFEQKTTLGEFDFLLQEIENNCLVHLEMVYKFYLFDSRHPEKWIGPNRKDFVRLKLEKLEEKQFPLLRSNEGTKRLKEVGISETPINQSLLFLGKLFVPFQQAYDLNGLNPAAIQGYWFRLTDFINYLNKSLAFIPEKQDWLQEGDLNAEWKSPRDVREELMYHLENMRSPMVWIKREDRIEQAFVVWWNK